MISIEEAFERITRDIQSLDTLTLPLDQAAGHTIAGDLASRRHQPPADVSAMDGFAMMADPDRDKWPLVGTSAAGSPYEGKVPDGACVRIYTGAEVPEGADTVIIQENTNWPADDSMVSINPEEVDVCCLQSNRNIRHKGNDFAAGELLLEAGTLIGARQISLAAMGGHGELTVHRKPVVALLANGDELLPPGECNDTNRAIPNSNGFMLRAMIRAGGGIPLDLGTASDDPADIKRRVQEAGHFDVLVTIGGASVGDRDFIQTALAELGLQTDFWKINMKPGKPLIHGHLSGRPFVGLPGNPVSAYVGAFLFLLPLVRALSGGEASLPRSEQRILAGSLGKNNRRVNLARGVMTPDGRIMPVSSQDSSLSRALAKADGLIRQDADCPGLNAGDSVEFMPFPAGV